MEQTPHLERSTLTEFPPAPQTQEGNMDTLSAALMRLEEAIRAKKLKPEALAELHALAKRLLTSS